MRSTFYVFLSSLIHTGILILLLTAPTSTMTPSGAVVEVDLGQTEQKTPGVETATAPVEKPKAVAKANSPERPKLQTRPIVKAKNIAPSPPVVEPQQEPEVASEPSSQFISEPAPEIAAIPTPEPVESQTEAESADLAKTEEPAAETGSGGSAMMSEEHLGKGGDTQAGAVSYMDLKQRAGNRAPIYPRKARLEKREGELELVYQVTKEGRVQDVSIAKSSGHTDLDEAAVAAISRFRFVPGQEGWARHPVTFTIRQSTAQAE